MIKQQFLQWSVFNLNGLSFEDIPGPSFQEDSEIIYEATDSRGEALKNTLWESGGPVTLFIST